MVAATRARTMLYFLTDLARITYRKIVPEVGGIWFSTTWSRYHVDRGCGRPVRRPANE